jgi:hypothetical protein
MKKSVIVFAILFASCTENERAKSFGGKAEIVLPANEKLVVATWKETSLWYLTKPMDSADKAETYTFREESSFGVMEGTYIIKEVKK